MENKLNIVSSDNIGGLFINKVNGSSNYYIDIEGATLISGPEPVLFLLYSSLPGESAIRSGPGWQLKGVPELVSTSNGRYFDGTNFVSAQKSGNDLLTVTSTKASTITYKKCKANAGESDRYTAVTAKDAYGNRLEFVYGSGKNSDILQEARYGLEKNRKCSIRFTYDHLNGYLTDIGCYHNSQQVRKYKLTYDGDNLTEITLSAWDSDNPLVEYQKPAVRFEWGTSTQTAGLLTGLSEASGKYISITYNETEPGTVSAINTKVKGLEKQPYNYRSLVNVSNLQDSPLFGWIAEEVKIWDDSEKRGEFYQSDISGKYPGAILTQGVFSNDLEDGPGESLAVIEFDGIKPGKTTRHYIIEQLDAEYELHDCGKTVLTKQTKQKYFDKGQALPTETVLFEYDSDGNQVRIATDNTVQTISIAKPPAEANPALRLMERSSLYDKNGTLLKDQKYAYGFDYATGNINQISGTVLIDEGVYSKPTISRINKLGMTEEMITPSGTVMVTQYSDDFCTQTQKFISADGKNTKSESITVDPVTGNQIRLVSSDGAVTETIHDVFGEVHAIKGFDPGDPKSWQDPAALAVLTSSSREYDKRINMQYLKATKSLATPNQTVEKRTYLDSLSRPIAEARQLDKKLWEVTLLKYASPTHPASQSLPIRIKSDGVSLGQEIKAAYTKPATKWIEKKFDDYGRPVGDTLPDGSKETTEYELDSEKNLVLTVKRETKNGELISISSEIRSPLGIIESYNGSDKKPTTFLRDALGQIISRTDPTGQKTTYKWNALGSCKEEVNPISGTIKVAFGQNLQVSSINRNGHILSYAYDWLNRTIEQKTENPETGKSEIQRMIYSEDKDYRSTSVTRILPEGWQITSRFSPNGGEVERTLKLGEEYSETVKTEFCTNGLVAKRRYPDGRALQYFYDNSGNQTEINWENSKTAPLAIFSGVGPQGQPLISRYGNNVVEIRDFDPFGNQKDFIVYNGKNTNQAPYIAIGYGSDDGMGRLTTARVQSADGKLISAENYQIEVSGQLTGISSKTKSLARQFGDADTLEKVVVNDQVMKFTPNKTGYQIEKITGKETLQLKYDIGGNVCQIASGKETQDLEFDILGNLLSHRRTVGMASSTTSYVTDGLGNRIIKVLPDGTSLIFVDNDYQVTILPDGRTLRTVYAAHYTGNFLESTIEEKDARKRQLFKAFPKAKESIPGKAVSTMNGNGIVTPGDLYVHLDGLGSSLASTDATGKKIATVEFDLNGIIQESGCQGEYRFNLTFAGMLYEPESGLYFHGARYFSPATLRFLSPDPLQTTTDPYAYPSDPVNVIDIEGNCWECLQSYCGNWKKKFRQFWGRQPTVAGNSVVAFLVPIAAWPIVDSLFTEDGLDYNQTRILDRTLTYGQDWALALCFWFGMIFLMKGTVTALSQSRFKWINSCASICDSCKDTRLVADRHRHACGPNTEFIIKAFVGGIHGVVLFSPLFSIITGANPEDDFEIFAFRGFINGFTINFFAAAVGVWIFKPYFRCTGTSLINLWIQDTTLLVVAMLSWQFLDYGLLALIRESNNRDLIWAHKKAFVFTELMLAPFLVKSNPLWSLIPAIINCCRWKGLMEQERPYSIELIANYGKMIPWCCWDDLFNDSEIQERPKITSADLKLIKTVIKNNENLHNELSVMLEVRGASIAAQTGNNTGNSDIQNVLMNIDAKDDQDDKDDKDDEKIEMQSVPNTTDETVNLQIDEKTHEKDNENRSAQQNEDAEIIDENDDASESGNETAALNPKKPSSQNEIDTANLQIHETVNDNDDNNSKVEEDNTSEVDDETQNLKPQKSPLSKIKDKDENSEEE